MHVSHLDLPEDVLAEQDLGVVRLDPNRIAHVRASGTRAGATSVDPVNPSSLGSTIGPALPPNPTIDTVGDPNQPASPVARTGDVKGSHLEGRSAMSLP